MKEKVKQKRDPHYNCDSHVNSPWANSQTRYKDSNVTLPSDQDVEEAKDWVDYNEK